MPLTVFAADHERRAARPLDHSRGGNADDSAMPSLSIEDDATCVRELRFCQPRFERLHDLQLALLTVGVELIQSRCEIARLLLLASFEEFDHGLGHIHAPGGIHAWSDAESNVGCGELTLLVGKLRDGHKRA